MKINSLSTVLRTAARGLFVLKMASIGPAGAQSLHQLVEAAASRNPELAAAPARAASRQAEVRAAGAWTPAPPSLAGSFVTDQWLHDRSQREAQVSITTPLWLPGQGSASRAVAVTGVAAGDAEAARLNLMVAGQVREALADVALARAELGAAKNQNREARTLEADTMRRQAAREAGATDMLQAQAERLTADRAVRAAETNVEQTELDFATLTGLPAAPGALETRPMAPSQVHPLLQAAHAAMAAAEARRRLAQLDVRDNPEIGLVARRNRDMFGSVYDNSVGVELRIPLATGARNAPRQTAAEADYAQAVAVFAAAGREVAAAMEKARTAYQSALAQRDLAHARADLLARGAQLSREQYRAGEISLAEDSRAVSLGVDGARVAAEADIAVLRMVGRFNQANGWIP